MLNRQREDKIDQFIEVDKLIPIVEKHKFPLSRIREILSSRAFTPEWKIRELRLIQQSDAFVGDFPIRRNLAQLRGG